MQFPYIVSRTEAFLSINFKYSNYDLAAAGKGRDLFPLTSIIGIYRFHILSPHQQNLG